ncbi:MAG: TrbI/VirB10 family protein [Alphaproteobacteria bacterium]|nr:TrbI/VirB10 family protein [Alphaproteobacteria bacterium]
MSKLKEQISELRQNTPKRVQWLLLAAAFVVVLILLTLLLSGDDNSASEIEDTVPAELKIAPDMVNWSDVIVGQKKTETVKVSATADAMIADVRTHEEIKGLILRDTCKKIRKIGPTVACEIFLEYAPTAPMATKNLPVFIDWYGADATDAMTKTAKIVLTLGATAPVAQPKPEQKPEPEPVVVPTPVLDAIPADDFASEQEIEAEPEPIVIKEEIKREVEAIAPAITIKQPAAEPVAEKGIVIPDGCSDFAFPAYGTNGRQIGWIKPSGGAYYYHPFADKECRKAAGVYNPDNGIITDDSGKRIGTDAEHIGWAAISGGAIPKLSNAPAIKQVNRAEQLELSKLPNSGGAGRLSADGIESLGGLKSAPQEDVIYGTSGDEYAVISTQPYDRSFVLRQYKPIPATIVSEVRADASVYKDGHPLPVRATVDRNVYSDDGRNIIIPAGTLMLGYVTGDLPGPYKAIGRMQINWYQFIRPDGVEFNFDTDNNPFAGDAQGRVGVPGRGSTDYMEQFIMPMLTAIVPAAVNLIAPVSDAFVNQIDLDNNTVVQSGTVRSSELAKNEIITAWNQVAQKLMVDMMDNTVPPFTIAAGTRITVYSPEDLIVVCGPDQGKCYVKEYYSRSLASKREQYNSDKLRGSVNIDQSGPDWIGQVRSFAVGECCENGKVKNGYENDSRCNTYDYRTLLFYCQSSQYEAINNAKQQAVYENQQSTDNKNSVAYISNQGQQAYNEQVLGLTYDEETGAIENPFNQPDAPTEEAPAPIMCEGNVAPDANGCCPGETYTDMGEQGFNCCPDTGGDCFPPII